MNPKADTIQSLIDSYASLVLARDLDGFIGLYDTNVRIFDTWGVWSYEGTDAWRGAVAQWFGSLGDEQVKVAFDDVRAQIFGDVASVSAIGSYAAVTPDGTVDKSMQNRLSWTLHRTDDCWRILHEHTSAPIGFTDMKAILQRD